MKTGDAKPWVLILRSILEALSSISSGPDARHQGASPVHASNSDRIIAVAEFYQRVDPLLSEIAAAQRLSWLVVAAAIACVLSVSEARAEEGRRA